MCHRVIVYSTISNHRSGTACCPKQTGPGYEGGEACELPEVERPPRVLVDLGRHTPPSTLYHPLQS